MCLSPQAKNTIARFFFINLRKFAPRRILLIGVHRGKCPRGPIRSISDRRDWRLGHARYRANCQTRRLRSGKQNQPGRGRARALRVLRRLDRSVHSGAATGNNNDAVAVSADERRFLRRVGAPHSGSGTARTALGLEGAPKHLLATIFSRRMPAHKIHSLVARRTGYGALVESKSASQTWRG